MPGILDESKEERKWPSWLRWLTIFYVIILVFNSVTVPTIIYTIDTIFIPIFLWVPVFVAAMYFIEKPDFVHAHMHMSRVVFAVLALNAISWGLILAYSFV